jgi:hypothetical protein
MSSSRHLFFRDLCARLGVPGTYQNALALIAQAQAEGSPKTSRLGGAKFNPLNCTVRAEGSSDYNPDPIHVQNYMSWAQGLEVTAAMLRQENMAPLYAALKKGDSATANWQARGVSPWGTKPPAGYTIGRWLEDARRHWYDRAMIPIAGS